MAYEFDGRKYESASAHQKQWGNKIISELRLAGTESVLDLGCGDGKLTENLADLVPYGSVLGIDASEGMISVANERSGNNLSFMVLDINELNLDRKFDLIFSNATLHWIKDHHELWASINKILNPAGTVRVNFAADGNCSNLIRILSETMARLEFRDLFAGFEWPWYMPSIGDYTEILEEFGFADCRVWGENNDRLFQTREDLVGWIDQPSIVPFLKHITAESKKKLFREYVVTRMLKETARPDEGFFETFRRINILVKNK
jgi:trans-aconitate 2-methyltransferase